jgi:hypothetical protein
MQHAGFMGFTDLKPVRETTVQLILSIEDKAHGLTLSIVENVPVGSALDEFTSGVGQFGAVSGLGGTGTDLGYGGKIKLIRDRRAGILHWDQPHYPTLAKLEYVQGEAIAVLYVDNNGWLSILPDSLHLGYADRIKQMFVEDFGPKRIIEYIIREEPAGEGFAENLIKTFPSAQLIPAVKDGRPIGQLLWVKMVYCLAGPECSDMNLAISN